LYLFKSKKNDSVTNDSVKKKLKSRELVELACQAIALGDGWSPVRQLITEFSFKG
jgi:hypothetical protein